MTGLKSQCCIVLAKQIKLETAVELALLADLHHAEKLKEAALQLFVDNKKLLQQKPDWHETFIKNPSLLMQMFEM